jgi:hypothetical protein
MARPPGVQVRHGWANPPSPLLMRGAQQRLWTGQDSGDKDNMCAELLPYQAGLKTSRKCIRDKSGTGSGVPCREQGEGRRREGLAVRANIHTRMCTHAQADLGEMTRTNVYYRSDERDSDCHMT